MDMFASQAIDQANLRMVAYAKRRFPEYFCAETDNAIKAFVSTVRNQAKGYGISNEDDVATALDLTVMYGKDFYDANWAADVIALVELIGAEKMEILRQRVRAQTPSL